MALGIGAAAALGWGGAAQAGASVMPSYLGAWLFCLAVPAGALPLVMVSELLDCPETPLTTMLRRFASALPVVAVFALPIVLRSGALYRHPLLPPHGAFIGRMIAMLLAWSLLALVFARPPRHASRRRLSALGLCLHLVIGTLAALDWVMSVEPELNSSAFGLLLISAQISAALCAALLVLPMTRHRDAVPDEASMLLLVSLAAWGCLHFIQYQIIWSADLPKEIVWYQARIVGLGQAALWFGAAVLVGSSAVLLPRLGRRAPVLASVSAMGLLLHLVESLWLVTPSFRRGFTLSWLDLLALVALIGLGAGFLLIEGRRHEPA